MGRHPETSCILTVTSRRFSQPDHGSRLPSPRRLAQAREPIAHCGIKNSQVVGLALPVDEAIGKSHEGVTLGPLFVRHGDLGSRNSERNDSPPPCSQLARSAKCAGAPEEKEQGQGSPNYPIYRDLSQIGAPIIIGATKEVSCRLFATSLCFGPAPSLDWAEISTASSCRHPDERKRQSMSVAIVTGSAGLIGSEASRFFAGEGFGVVGIDNDMRREFFGDEASTHWNRQRLE